MALVLAYAGDQEVVDDLGTEGEGLRVGDINPRFVAERLREISRVRLEGIRVEVLE